MKRTMVIVVLSTLLLASVGATAAVATPTDARGEHTVPFVGSFSGTSTSIAGGIDDVGTGTFTHCGRSEVQGHEVVIPGSPYGGTITAANGDKIYFSGLVTSGTYVITGGTGRFADAGGSGQLSLERVEVGGQLIVNGHLDGTIIFAS